MNLSANAQWTREEYIHTIILLEKYIWYHDSLIHIYCTVSCSIVAINEEWHGHYEKTENRPKTWNGRGKSLIAAKVTVSVSP